jgi:hypothetical protein
MDDEDRLLSSVTRLAERVGAVAAEVERAMAVPLVLPHEVLACRRWITTGVGASEGPARLLASRLRAGGRVADFAPVSSFADGAPPADACVVVSQGLSPNARLPLARIGSYARTVLVTTVDADDLRARGVIVVQHGPAAEGDLLLRVVGPAAANATVLRIAAAVGAGDDGGDVGEALATAGARAKRALGDADAAALFDLAGLVAAGADAELAEGLRHKLLEGLGISEPPVWDVCSIVHGPLQSFYERDATLVLLERDGRRTDLTDRLTRVLLPRHRVVRLRSALPGALALLDWDLQLDHLVLAALRARPRDLVDWPGKGRDAPLYDLGTGGI